jgi:iron complex transport system substrate-binding protein
MVGQALHSASHWETGKASGVPKPGDLSVRATMKPSGEGWWRCSVAQATAHRPFLRRGMGGIIYGTLTCQPGLRGLLAAMLLGVGLAGTACHEHPRQASGSIQVVDDAGDTVRLQAPARRIVSLIPAGTELLFAVGAGPSVVGRTSYCDYPPAAKVVPDLGDGIKPSIEAVLAQRPDLVVLYNSGQNAAVAGRLGELGIPALRVNTDALSDVGRVARMLGTLTGRQHGADSVTAVFDTALAAATRHPKAPRPRILLLVWEQPPMTIGRGSFLHELVERAGGENLFADVSASSGIVSVEAVAARNPDLIFTTNEGPAAFATRPEWQVVPAIREHRFLRVSGSEFNWPSPRSPAAIRELTARMETARR